MTRISSVFLPLLMVIFHGCGGQGSGSPMIKGTIDNAGGKTLYLQKYQGRSPQNIDSTKIGKNGSFELVNTTGKLDFYGLKVGKQQNNNRVMLITDSTETVEVQANLSTMSRKAQISGSEHSQKLQKFNSIVAPYKGRLDSLATLIRSGKGGTSAREDFQKLRGEYSSKARAFVKKNTSSPAVLPALSALNPNKDIELFKKVHKDLKPVIGHSQYFAHLGKRIKQLQARKKQQELNKKKQAERKKLLEKGKKAPELEMKNPQGEKVALSDLRGKVVLIDFWASWCKPCIKELPHIKDLYEKYNDKGFEIYGVSLDRKEQKWKGAIEKYNMDWVHVSDLGFWNSAAAQKYKVNSIPFTVLVDREGKIIATGLRANGLKEKLKEIFSS